MSNIFLPFGRIRRTHYVMLSVVFAVLWLLVAKLLGAVLDPDNRTTAFIVLPFVVVLALPQFSVGLQRAHDIGAQKYVWGWNAYMLLNGLVIIGAFKTLFRNDYVPPQYFIDYGVAQMLGIGLVLLLTLGVILAICWLHLALLLAPGEAGTNRYGDDPRPENARVQVIFGTATDGSGQHGAHPLRIPFSGSSD